MLIGNRYSATKLYRGIKHYDSLPLTSGDLHEYADILQMKNSYLTNNIIGSGTLNEPACSISASGISLSTPSVLLLDGDISLINSSVGIPFISKTDIINSGITNGIVCIVGWYQSLTTQSTLREYGGVKNSILPNDIIDTSLNIQVSTRYQLRWDTIILDESAYSESENVTFTILNRDATGAVLSGSSTITTTSSVNLTKIAPKPVHMDYATSDLYIVPILKFTYTGDNITSATPFKSIKPIGSSSFISSPTEPDGADYDEGTIWYNSTDSTIKIYVPSVGFVATDKELALVQYTNTITVESATSSPTDLEFNIGINSYTEDDIIQVLYGGVVLTPNLHYTVNPTTKKILLLGFVTEVGDIITILVTKLTNMSASDTILSEFNTHVSLYGNSVVKGHVSLSDTANSALGTVSNIAVTPKALYDATTLLDATTNQRYRLVVNNGVLGIEQI